MFNLCYEYKLKWNKEYYTTPILNALVFDKLKAILGGKLSFLLSGSAPLSAETQVCTKYYPLDNWGLYLSNFIRSF